MIELETLTKVIQAIKELPDPYAWADSFRKSWRKYRRSSEMTELASDCKELNSALFNLEANPSLFLYSVVNRKALYNLTDEELGSADTLKKIERAAGEFRKDLDRVLDAMKSVEERAYKKFGEVFVQGIKGLNERRRLLEELDSLVREQRRPREIRELAQAYEQLIEGIQPLREEIRSFVDKHS